MPPKLSTAAAAAPVPVPAAAAAPVQVAAPTHVTAIAHGTAAGAESPPFASGYGSLAGTSPATPNTASLSPPDSPPGSTAPAASPTSDGTDGDSEPGAEASSVKAEPDRLWRRWIRLITPLKVKFPRAFDLGQYRDMDEARQQYLMYCIQHQRAEYWEFFKQWVTPVEPGWLFKRSKMIVNIGSSSEEPVPDQLMCPLSEGGGDIHQLDMPKYSARPHKRTSDEAAEDGANDSRATAPIYGASVTRGCDLVVTSAQITHVIRNAAGPASPLATALPLSGDSKFKQIRANDQALQQLKGRLCRFRGNLYFAYRTEFTCGCAFRGESREQEGTGRIVCSEDGHENSFLQLFLRKIMTMDKYPDAEVAASSDRETLLFASDFCFNFIKIASVLSQMLQDITSATDGASEPFPQLTWFVDPVVGCCRTQATYQPLPAKEGAAGGAASTLSASGQCEQAEQPQLEVGSIFNSKSDVLLCDAQRDVLNSFGHGLELVQGPPGTGKSTCIRSVVRHCLPTAAGDAILLLALQNKAVDVLVSMFEQYVVNDFATSDMSMLVVGGSNKVNMGVISKKYTLSNIVEGNAEYCALKAQCVAFVGTPSDTRAQWKKLTDLKKKLYVDVCNDVSLVFSTFDDSHKIRTGSKHWRGLAERITTIIVDEAGCVPDSYMPLLTIFPRVERILCFGDPKQLLPFTHQPSHLLPLPSFMGRCELRFDKLPAKSKKQLSMLTTQFRMHPNIANVVSTVFYDGRLQNDEVSTKARVAPFEGGRVRLSGLYWLDCSTHHGSQVGGSSVVDDDLTLEHFTGSSYLNASEIWHIVELLKLLSQSPVVPVDPKQHRSRQKKRSIELKEVPSCPVLDFFDKKSVLIITFYRPQATWLISQIQQHVPQATKALENGSLRVQTVDSSQGCEADIVIISCVRSNADKDLGFLGGNTGPNRMCVALSRAREALVVVGDHRLMGTLPEKLPAFYLLWQSTQTGGMVPTPPPQRHAAAPVAPLAAAPPSNPSADPTPAEARSIIRKKKSKKQHASGQSRGSTAPATASVSGPAVPQPKPSPNPGRLHVNLLHRADNLVHHALQREQFAADMDAWLGSCPALSMPQVAEDDGLEGAPEPACSPSTSAAQAEMAKIREAEDDFMA